MQLWRPHAANRTLARENHGRRVPLSTATEQR